VLSALLRSAQSQCGVAAVGLAGGAELTVSLMPFLLRGVNLLGVNSAATRRDKRLLVWKRVAGDLRPRHLERIATGAVTLEELPQACAAVLAGSHTGRTLVRIAADER
jgi:NADPH2:quinone reductase